MRFLLQGILGALWLGACSTAWAGSSPGGARPPVPWPTVEEVQRAGAPQDTAQLLEWLVSTDRASSAEAQIRLLSVVDDTLLPQLESLAAHHPRQGERERMREFLRVSTTHWVQVGQLARFPTLAALVREDVARGLRLVASWKDVDSIEGIMPGGGDGPNSLGSEEPIIQGAALKSLSTALRPLGGLALPAIERWLSSDSPHERLRGMALANRLGVRPQQQLLDRLRADQTQVGLEWAFPAEPPSKEVQTHQALRSIAQLAEGLRAQLDSSPLPSEKVWARLHRRSTPWFEIMNKTDPTLFIAFYDPTWSTGGVQDEQEYWNLMRPLWRAWWKGELRNEPSLEVGLHSTINPVWNNRLIRFLGYQFIDSKSSGDPAFLRLEGPAGTEVEVSYFQSREYIPVARQEVLPFSQTGVPPSSRFEVRVRTGQDWMDFNPGLFVAEGRTVTVWLEPTLRRAYPRRCGSARPRRAR